MTSRKNLTRIRLWSRIFSISSLRLNMIRYTQIWCKNVNRTYPNNLQTDLASIWRNFIKGRLLEIDRNIKKLKYHKIFFLAMVCLDFPWLKEFLKILCCLIWRNRLLNTPTARLYWLSWLAWILREIYFSNSLLHLL